MSIVNKALIVRDPADVTAQAGPVSWALSQLREALADRGVACEEMPVGEGVRVIAATPASARARDVLDAAGVTPPAADEALAIVPGRHAGGPAVLACGADARGLVYAVLELADRVTHSSEPLAALVGAHTAAERPANRVRGVARLFTSDVEDKPWFYDRGFWQQYLTMLASQRFNRFHLAFGIGHDFVRNVIDAYFLFAYPFLVSVPGYDVRAVGLPDEERARNLAMLRWISDETAARGLDFQLGLWMHAYEWVDSPNANYTITGLTPENHAAYCRDALQAVLDACPAIASLTFRVHGESGVPEGSYGFWRTVLAGAVRPGRRIEINLHPKGIDQRMIDLALATGLPVTISPKYTAEHLGLPYQQAMIRATEQARERARGEQFYSSLMSMSEGSLRYTRYGYADFLKRDRRYGVFSRIWPGTDRLLLWGDPALAAGIGRSGSFCGCLGVEVCEPLSFKGRLGSGLPGGRNAYADASLRPAYDFEKYAYTYRLLGRLLYNPEASPDQWRRYLEHEFGPAADAVERALASASRILPLVTMSHMPSAHYGCFFPEIYTHMPIVDETIPHPYRDTDEPRCFGNVSALDPAIFSKPEEFADEVVRGRRSGRYSPLRVAEWLDTLATEAAGSLAAAGSAVADRTRPGFRRMAIDVTVASCLGRFFADELRASVAYALYLRTGEVGRLRQAVEAHRAARAAWAGTVEATRGVYRDDITFGPAANVRGHWADRLPALDADLAAMEAKLQQAEADASSGGRPAGAPPAPLASLDETPPDAGCIHAPADGFRPGQPVVVLLQGVEGLSARLHYRHVNQAESYIIVDMAGAHGALQTTVPGDYTDSPYALEYFFELHDGAGRAWLHPGLNATLSNQPYFVLQQTAGRPSQADGSARKL
jgi:hypothetical protein